MRWRGSCRAFRPWSGISRSLFLEGTTWRSVEAAIRGLGIVELQTVRLVENWRNPKKFPGVFSMLIRTVFQSTDRTLVDTELAGWSAGIIGALEALGGTLRT